MRRITIAAFAIFFTTLAFADEWSGQLVDADCTHRNGGPQACDPGFNTTSFGLVVAGKAYVFDWKGSQRAERAIKLRAGLRGHPDRPPRSPITASVTGKRAGNTLLVKRIVLE